MQHTKDNCIEEEDLEENNNTTKFLELLLRYNYFSCSVYEECFMLSLSEKDKPQFLKECSEFLQDLDEGEAAKKIVNIRHRYNEILQNNVDKSKFSWFSLAHKLFKRNLPSTSTATSTPVSMPLKHKEILEGSSSASQSFQAAYDPFVRAILCSWNLGTSTGTPVSRPLNHIEGSGDSMSASQNLMQEVTSTSTHGRSLNVKLILGEH